MNHSIYLTVASLLCLVIGCSQQADSGKTAKTGKSSVSDMYLDEPIHDQPPGITVQHCLIGFTGTTSKPVERTQEEAEALARKLFEKAKAGEDFDALVKEHTDDSHPGIFKMVNIGFSGSENRFASPAKRIFAREQMVSAFGDVSFALEVGEVGMTEFDPDSSPFGFHIIKRLK